MTWMCTVVRDLLVGRELGLVAVSHDYVSALAQASQPIFGIRCREILAFHVKNREIGQTPNFPVLTVSL